MKKIFIFGLSGLLLSGCAQTSVYNTSTRGTNYIVRGSWFNLPANNVITVINNTPFVLSVFEDGIRISKDLQPGDIFTDQVTTALYSAELTLVVQASGAGGGLVGTQARVFQLQNYGRVGQVWSVSNLIPIGQ
jgi:hypothetical protein